jgi:uncharacterized protein (DUF983 family)
MRRLSIFALLFACFRGTSPRPCSSLSEWKQILRRGLRMRCPRCGEGKIFRRIVTYSEFRECAQCQLIYDERGESFGFMYLSTAFITGLWFLVLLLFPPTNLTLYRVVLVAGALTLYAVTTPFRKSLAIAFNYFNKQ